MTAKLGAAVVWLLLFVSSAEARQTGNVDPVGDRFILSAAGTYTFVLRVQNHCDWMQSVATRLQSLASPVTAERSVAADGETEVLVTIAPIPGFDREGLDFSARHNIASQGAKVCEFAEVSRVILIEWRDDARGVLPSSGRLGDPVDLVLTQRVVPAETSTPATVPATPGAPATPATPQDGGTGLDFPAIPIPAVPTVPDDVDTDALFGGRPDQPRPPKSDTTSITSSLTFPRGTLTDSIGTSVSNGLIDSIATPPCPTDNDCFEMDDCVGGSCGVTPPLIPEPKGGFDLRYQTMGGELLNTGLNQTALAPIPMPVPQMEVRRLNPLGLLARSITEFMEWWSPALHAAETLTIEQAGRIPGGLQFLITSLGGSTGRNLSMQVLNFTGKPVTLHGILALEPLKSDAQQRVTQAFSKLARGAVPSRVDLRGYCFEFLKLPPNAGQLMTVAAPEAQKRFAPLKSVMAAATRLQAAGRLRPDSTPEAYGDSIKQWAVWSVEQKFNQTRFMDAFVTHTRKNVEAAGQPWSRQAEEVIRKVSPNRWQDIVNVLAGAGMQVSSQ